MDRKTAAREYYRAIDEGDWAELEALLAPEFVHDRPDRTLEGRGAFLSFMREERPNPDTVHRLEGIYSGPGVAVEGILEEEESGEELVRFMDVFTVGGDGFTELRTYTR